MFKKGLFVSIQTLQKDITKVRLRYITRLFITEVRE
jgi:hypothetical protein